MNNGIGLRRFVTDPPSATQAGVAADRSAPEAPAEGTSDASKCELCSTEISAEHGHLVDLDGSSLLCSCRACYLLFTHAGGAGGRYHAVPDRYLADPARQLTSAEWDELEIPVGLAFFLHSSRQGTVSAFYPSPAGATECRLDLSAWSRLADAYPLLKKAEPDVEAILISKSASGIESFVVPVDACYELAGRMRLHWRGFDGGAEARQAIAEFLAAVRSRALAGFRLPERP
jgi:hypothetical protein